MPIVLDASLLIALVSKDPRSGKVEAHLEGWLKQGEELHAPHLLPFEVASGLNRLVGAKIFPGDQVELAWAFLRALPLIYHPCNSAVQVVQLAQKMQRKSAYDAAYLALALELESELWTLDGKLARNAQDRGLPVRLIGD